MLNGEYSVWLPLICANSDDISVLFAWNKRLVYWLRRGSAPHAFPVLRGLCVHVSCWILSGDIHFLSPSPLAVRAQSLVNRENCLWCGPCVCAPARCDVLAYLPAMTKRKTLTHLAHSTSHAFPTSGKNQLCKFHEKIAMFAGVGGECWLCTCENMQLQLETPRAAQYLEKISLR